MKNKETLLSMLQSAVADYSCDYHDMDFDIDVHISVEMDGQRLHRKIRETMGYRFAIDPKDGKQASFHRYNPNSFWYRLWEENMLRLGFNIK